MTKIVFERILDGELCLLGLMETWEDGIEHMLVINIAQRDKVYEFARIQMNILRIIR